MSRPASRSIDSSSAARVAQRAAKQIKELIGDSVEKVRTGSELVDESGRVLGEIMDSVKKVSDIVAEIAATSEERGGSVRTTTVASEHKVVPMATRPATRPVASRAKQAAVTAPRPLAKASGEDSV